MNELLSTSDNEKIRELLKALIDMPMFGFLDKIVPFLKSEDFGVRRRALDILRKYSPAGFEQELIDFIEGSFHEAPGDNLPHLVVLSFECNRLEAVDLLIAVNHPKGYRYLEMALNHDPLWDRYKDPSLYPDNKFLREGTEVYSKGTVPKTISSKALEILKKYELAQYEKELLDFAQSAFPDYPSADEGNSVLLVIATERHALGEALLLLEKWQGGTETVYPIARERVLKDRIRHVDAFVEVVKRHGDTDKDEKLLTEYFEKKAMGKAVSGKDAPPAERLPLVLVPSMTQEQKESREFYNRLEKIEELFEKELSEKGEEALKKLLLPPRENFMENYHHRSICLWIEKYRWDWCEGFLEEVCKWSSWEEMLFSLRSFNPAKAREMALNFLDKMASTSPIFAHDNWYSKDKLAVEMIHYEPLEYMAKCAKCGAWYSAVKGQYLKTAGPKEKPAARNEHYYRYRHNVILFDQAGRWEEIGCLGPTEEYSLAGKGAGSSAKNLLAREYLPKENFPDALKVNNWRDQLYILAFIKRFGDSEPSI